MLIFSRTSIEFKIFQSIVQGSKDYLRQCLLVLSLVPFSAFESWDTKYVKVILPNFIKFIKFIFKILLLSLSVYFYSYCTLLLLLVLSVMLFNKLFRWGGVTPWRKGWVNLRKSEPFAYKKSSMGKTILLPLPLLFPFLHFPPLLSNLPLFIFQLS